MDVHFELAARPGAGEGAVVRVGVQQLLVSSRSLNHALVEYDDMVGAEHG